MIAPFSSSTRSGVVPELREVSSASSTCWREASPMSTITSVRKRCEDPRREGRVMPDQALSSASGWSASSGGGSSITSSSSTVLSSARSGRSAASASRSMSSSGASVRSSAMTGSLLASGSPSMPKIACRSGPVFCASFIVRAPPAAARYPAGCSSRAAPRMTSSGAFLPVQSSKLRAPCATRISRPSSVRAPCARAAASSGVDPER